MFDNANRIRDLKKVQKYYFAAYDLHLFLDTHPYNKEALKMYSAMIEKAKSAQDEFESKYGSLTPLSAACDTEKWNWLENPWPWDSLEN